MPASRGLRSSSSTWKRRRSGNRSSMIELVKLAEPPSYFLDNVSENLHALALADLVQFPPHRLNAVD
jgi:hypothetical protein